MAGKYFAGERQQRRDILYFMQGEVARIMLARGRRAADNRG